MTRIFLSDHGGNFDAFCDACYQAYLQFWQGNPALLGKRLVRHRTMGEDGKEKVFWEIVDGHDPQSQSGTTERYEKIPCLAYLVTAAAGNNPDVKWFRNRHNGKIRIHIFSQTHRYLMVLQERRNQDVLDFISGHPISTKKLNTLLQRHAESLRAENGIL